MNREEAYQTSVNNRAIRNTEDTQALIKNLKLAVDSGVKQGYTNTAYFYNEGNQYSISPRENPECFSIVRKHFEDLGYLFRINNNFLDRGYVYITIDWGKKPEVPKKRPGFLRRIWGKK